MLFPPDLLGTLHTWLTSYLESTATFLPCLVWEGKTWPTQAWLLTAGIKVLCWQTNFLWLPLPEATSHIRQKSIITFTVSTNVLFLNISVWMKVDHFFALCNLPPSADTGQNNPIFLSGAGKSQSFAEAAEYLTPSCQENQQKLRTRIPGQF